ncbi:MAG: anti-sigma factor family protein [Polyangiaceae bacterium]
MSRHQDWEMRGAHLSGEELALYVIDALDPERKDRVERHVLACEECAMGLEREARVEAALEQVARLADQPVPAPISIMPAIRAAEVRARLVSAGRRSRWAGGVAGAFAAAAAMVLAFSSATAHSEPSGVGGVAQRAPGLHDAAGDMSGAFGMERAALGGDSPSGGEVVLRDALDGG